jgi:hypothetical protein
MGSARYPSPLDSPLKDAERLRLRNQTAPSKTKMMTFEKYCNVSIIERREAYNGAPFQGFMENGTYPNWTETEGGIA